jgi:hypothetical protein
MTVVAAEATAATPDERKRAAERLTARVRCAG